MMNDYALLKWADDPRWSNTRKRDAQKTLAEISEAAAEARAECQRLAATRTAGRLADAKVDVAALHRAVDGSHAGARLTDVAAAVAAAAGDGRATVAYGGPVDSAGTVERSLQAKAARFGHRLAACRTRVAAKTALLARLHARVARNRFDELAPEIVAEQVAVPGGGGSVAVTEKVVDALKLCNRRMADTVVMIADNEVMYKRLNEQLMAEVRQQAATVVELVSYGSSAQQELAEFERRYCRAKADHDAAVRKKTALSRHLKSNIATQESNRMKMISSKMQNDLEEKINFDITEQISYYVPRSIHEESETNSNRSFVEYDNPMLLVDWIDNGPMESHMYRKEESLLSKDSSMDTNDAMVTDNESTTSFQYTYPADKVNLLKFGDGEHTRAMEAVEYVCDALDFSDMADVLRYFRTVKHMETRVRKMVTERKRMRGIVQKCLESAADLESDELNCVPKATLLLDVDIERVQRDGLDVQRQRLRAVNVETSEYGALFNELWFQLDNLAAKLDRCQVPTARKYQACMKNPAKCSETIADAESMLGGLCLGLCDAGDDNGTADRTRPGTAETETGDRHDGHCDTGCSGWESAMDACRKLVVQVHTKVKSCMAYVGGRHFDETDEKQPVARAYFNAKQQSHIQGAVLKRNEHNRMTPARTAEGSENDRWTGAAAAGILTREQTKNQAEKIVQWFLTPRDADDALKSRKPISFRKARIVM